MIIAVLTGLIGLAITTAILLLIRNDKLHSANGLGWLLVAGSFAGLGLAPNIFDYIAHFFGIGYPPILAIAVGMGLIIIKLLLDEIKHSKLRIRHQRLAQRMALLETELRRMRKQKATDEAQNNDKAA